ncbi:hypothetical protein AGMMS50267_16630 [Spirochaetia bacterium]|nr:hypothetical protein AGMMS50267_16630 [Spirochaetia bacterium]
MNKRTARAGGRRGNSEKGFASAQFLFILLFLSALSLGTGFYLHSLLQIEERARRNNRIASEINDILNEVTAAIYHDITPDINSVDDPVWAWNGKTVNGYTITVNPVSDRLNLNFVRKNVFDKTRLSLLLAPGSTSGDIQQFREDRGLSIFAADYQHFFDRELFWRYFSCYGWANINLTDEFAARKLALALTGSEQAAEGLRAAIQRQLLRRENVNRNNLRAVLGGDYDSLFPFVNAEPLMNINLVEPALLTELLSYSDYAVSFPERRQREILARRESGGIDAVDIPLVLGIDPQNPLVHYFGSITWFWEIIISGSQKSQRTVLCRLPVDAANQSEAIVFNIIEQRYQ